MADVVIAGAAGRMGCRLVALLQEAQRDQHLLDFAPAATARIDLPGIGDLQQRFFVGRDALRLHHRLVVADQAADRQLAEDDLIGAFLVARCVEVFDAHQPAPAVCTRIEPRSGECAVAPQGRAADYEGKPVEPSAAVAAALEPELARVAALRAEPLGAVASGPIGRAAPEAPLDAWVAYVYLRDNPAGPHEEYWLHAAGCRRWLRIRRDTLTHEIS